MSDSTLIIFIKNPELGKVKTRLAKDIGDEKALHIYKMLLAHTRLITQNLPVQKQLHYSSNITETDSWKKYDKYVQIEGDLGQKMSHAFATVSPSSQKIVIIGSDCAELTSEILLQAYAALDDNDLVIGPANDGGYYLLGMQKHHSELFDEVEWSTERVFDQTIDKANKIGLSIFTLPELVDVDTKADWDLVKSNFEFPEYPAQQEEGRHYYFENGFLVFTELYHLMRGNCCGSGCRHCGYR
ncbi:TIGR04282 family arsenosugar biosynthesis glycosyltransferase [Reichenbachiella versicolor]|uniref:TIGR04282 family arsenosugar biosynthesis glycosyltransferase n=1 Tax=Reichenbachiella versicolor TaxID=1821036 RepID=UPI000D6E1B7C|nr:TIGR04282 family arsenosugar biosynthesis glycosyltransferase [Reichenbachiella versicolor]